MSLDAPSLLCSPGEILAAGRAEVGAKAFALARMGAAGLPVPQCRVVTSAACRLMAGQDDVQKALLAAASRLDTPGLRWEEIWDAALGVRNVFVRASIPLPIRDILADLAAQFGDRPLAVRSSSPSEDGVERSFAGLHDSILDVRGAEDLERAVRLVWASLWSDRALLYRRELGLTSASGMAVLVQPLLTGRVSGILFTEHPAHPGRASLEAITGGNDALVDGRTSPHRWELDRAQGAILEYRPPVDEEGNESLLSEDEIAKLWDLARACEELFGAPQDVEWTLGERGLILLQSRPVTALARPGTGSDHVRPWEEGDKRPWYLSLSRSFQGLAALRREVEEEVIPAMRAAAAEMTLLDPAGLDDAALAREIARREEVFAHWKETYWRVCIPLAHGVRLFGQAYNDALAPEDPFAFVDLLAGGDLAGLRRNALIEAMAEELRKDRVARERLEAGDFSILPERLAALRDAFAVEFGVLACHAGWCEEEEVGVLRLALRLAGTPQRQPAAKPDTAALERAYLAAHPPVRRRFAADLLELGRAAWRLRDDDNLALGRLEAGLLDAVVEGRARLSRRTIASTERLPAREVALCLAEPTRQPASASAPLSRDVTRQEFFRGGAAGPGVASGPARMVRDPSDLYGFLPGEVLVCAAVDPNMTFVIPLAAAVVEERGGMLIHGAIIAREYGLPCVTGARGIMAALRGGERLVVDGFRGEIRVLTDTGAQRRNE